VFLEDGERESVRLTVGELDLRARAIAAVLRDLPAGSRVLLVFPSGPEYVSAFFGCLYAGMVAVPAYPPPANRPMTRVETIAADAGAVAGLTTRGIAARAAAMPVFASMRWIAVEDVDPAMAEDAAVVDVHPDSIAFLQYTSGSTAAPRGVMVTHANLIHNQRILEASTHDVAQTSAVTWLPIHHDMGLIAMILRPLYAGIPCAVMPPAVFVQRPIRWLRAIARYRATAIAAPNFAYDLCVDRIPEEQRATLDLSSVTMAYNGSEPVLPETMRRFAAAFAPSGIRHEIFRPCYGLAEATLMVTCAGSGGPRIGSFDAAALAANRVVEGGAAPRTLASSGRVLLDTEIAIVDPESGARCAEANVGEICVRGATVAAGYWNNAEATAETFGLTVGGEGPFLRTGDVGFVRDGELFVTGRIKDLIIVDGRNHCPQDIELTVERSHAAFHGGIAAAFAIDDAGGERLVVAAEVARTYRGVRELVRGNGDAASDEGRELLRTVRRSVAVEHDIRVDALVLVPPGGVPRTSSGKRQRHVCRERYLAGTLGAVVR
jgi:acyl-CoA synthetase (AMP-forming)/AMP-acid ligase II